MKGNASIVLEPSPQLVGHAGNIQTLHVTYLTSSQDAFGKTRRGSRTSPANVDALSQ